MNPKAFHITLARLAASAGLLGEGQIVEFKADADETTNFLTSLKQIDQGLYEEKYPALIGRDLVAKEPQCVDDGSTSFATRCYDVVGMCTMIVNYSADLPSVNAFGKEVSVPLRNYGSSYEYSFEDVKRAARGYDLPSNLPRLARKVVETKLDHIIWLGDTEAGTTGLANNPNVGLTTPTTGSWTAATSIDLILADIEKVVSAWVALHKGVHVLTHVVLPYSTYRFLAKARSQYDAATGFQAFAAQFPGVTLLSSVKLETAGAGSTKRMIVGEFNSINQSALIPREFTMEAPQAKSLGYYVPCHAKCGGTLVRYPLSLRYSDGI